MCTTFIITLCKPQNHDDFKDTLTLCFSLYVPITGGFKIGRYKNWISKTLGRNDVFSFPVPANNDEKSNMNYYGSVRKELDEEYHNQADDLSETELLAFDSGDS